AVLDFEYMGVKIGSPLATPHGERKIPHRIADEGLDLRPKEARIVVGDVSGSLVTELAIHSDLFELVEQGVELSRIERIGKLTDQIGRPHEPGLGIGFLVHLVLRHREPRQLDRARNTLDVDDRMRGEAFPYEDLRAFDMIGSKARIRSAASEGRDLAFFV